MNPDIEEVYCRILTTNLSVLDRQPFTEHKRKFIYRGFVSGNFETVSVSWTPDALISKP